MDGQKTELTQTDIDGRKTQKQREENRKKSEKEKKIENRERVYVTSILDKKGRGTTTLYQHAHVPTHVHGRTHVRVTTPAYTCIRLHMLKSISTRLQRHTTCTAIRV